MAPSSIDSRPRHQQGLPPIAVTFSRQLPDDESRATDASLAELEQLLKGLGVRAAGRVAQRRREGLSYIGSGKLEELTATITELQAEHGPSNVLLAVDGELRPGQLLRLERALDIPVIDRTGVVLRIFEQQARTPIARLETEIARLEYEAPRVRETQAHDADRQGGGGRGGRGHTNVQLEKRRIRERLTTLRRELEDLASKEERQRSVRRDFLQVALVGYTNAGKSSLMRALTGSEVLVEDRLFATLGTTVRALSPPLAPPVLISDTVGFIRNLPHALVASFRSTLAEARDASLLLLVIDAADPEWREQLLVTRQGIEAIDAGELPALLVFNKIDGVPAEGRAELSREFPSSIQLSALDPTDVARLREAIAAAFDGELVSARLEVPFAEGRLLGDIRNRARVLDELHTEWGVELSVRGLPMDVEGWQRVLPARDVIAAS